ncbi:transcription initiation factor TFIID subunit 7 [Ancistrocladus abbreviatus]
MEEQFILRVPPSVAERIERLLNEDPPSSEDKELDLSFCEDGRNGTFVIGNDRFPVSLLDLPCVVESYKTYDDNVLIKTADIGQMIMVREEGDAAPDAVEYRHGLTPPMRDARRRRFRREPDLNPELVQRVENDLWNIMTTRNVEATAQEEDGEENASNAGKKVEPTPIEKPDVPDPATNAAEPERSDSDESDDSI